jgi:uncharacterized membrane protein
MLQRIQTALLALVSGLMLWFCFTNIWIKVNDKTAEKVIFTPSTLVYYSASMDGNTLSNPNVVETSNIYIFMVAIISALLAVISIFNYKKRVRQMKLGFLNSALMVILVMVVYYQITDAEKLFTHPVYGEYRMGFFLPIFSLGINLLANYYIKKDEDLVRSADRFR